MIYSGDTRLDLSDDAIVKFVQNGNKGDKFQTPISNQTDYHEVNHKIIDLGPVIAPNGLFVGWTVVEDYEVRSRGPRPQVLSKFSSSLTKTRGVAVNAKICLLVKDGTPPGVEDKIGSIFSSYSYPSSGDVDAYVTNALGNNADIGPLSFSLCRTYTVEILDDHATTLPRRPLNFPPEKYDIVRVREVVLGGRQMPVKPRNEIESTDDPKKAVEQLARENKRDTACEDFDTYSNEFARTDGFPETRMVWGWHTVKVGCAKFDLYYPETQKRDSLLVAEVWVTYPRMSAFKKAIESCANDAATSAIIMGIIFSDADTALSEFKALFWKCIDTKFNDTIDCLDGGVAVVTRPNGDWH